MGSQDLKSPRFVAVDVAMQFKSEASKPFFVVHLVPCVAILEVNNLIALHAAVLVGLGKYGTGLYRAYSIWCL